MTFAPELVPRLVALYAEVWEGGILPGTTREAVVIPLLKPDKPPTECAAYQPLLILNFDFTILSRILASRLLPQMATLVHRDQAGFIPGRNTAQNIRRLFAILDWGVLEGREGAIFSIDIEKAFDSLEWDFLYAVMARMGPGFILWVRILYTNPVARVHTGRTISE